MTAAATLVLCASLPGTKFLACERQRSGRETVRIAPSCKTLGHAGAEQLRGGLRTESGHSTRQGPRLPRPGHAKRCGSGETPHLVALVKHQEAVEAVALEPVDDPARGEGRQPLTMAAGPQKASPMNGPCILALCKRRSCKQTTQAIPKAAHWSSRLTPPLPPLTRVEYVLCVQKREGPKACVSVSKRQSGPM